MSGSQSGKAPPRVRPAASTRVSRLGGIAAYLRAGAASVALWRVLRRREREPRAKPESVFGFIALPDIAEERAQKTGSTLPPPPIRGRGECFHAFIIRPRAALVKLRAGERKKEAYPHTSTNKGRGRVKYTS